MCANCKLQLGKHLNDIQEQNDTPHSSNIHQQCHHFNQANENDSDSDPFPFQEFNSKELIRLQNELRDKNKLISAPNSNSVTSNLNLINSSDNEISLIDEKLREPLLHISNKLLGRQNLSFDQLTPPEQKLWNLYEKSAIYEFLTGETDTIPEFRYNWITCSAKPKVTFDLQTFLSDCNQANQQLTQGPPQSSQSATSQVQHFLRERKNKINYRTLATKFNKLPRNSRQNANRCANL